MVILKGFYTGQELSSAQESQGYKAEGFFGELEEELKIEIEQKVGSVVKIEFFVDNPECVCKIRFLSSLHAEECIKLMHGRYFDTR